jgi:hypothetical protein
MEGEAMTDMEYGLVRRRYLDARKPVKGHGLEPVGGVLVRY